MGSKRSGQSLLGRLRTSIVGTNSAPSMRAPAPIMGAGGAGGGAGGGGAAELRNGLWMGGLHGCGM